MNNRIIGIDVARAFAVIGMILVNFKMVLGKTGEGWLVSFTSVFDGKAAATFVVLAGIGITFLTKNSNKETSLKIIKRAAFLFIVGLSYIYVWPADILHFYGIYLLICLIFIKTKSHVSLFFALGIILIYPVLLFLFNYDTGWNFDTYDYDGFWTVYGFLRNLFYNGFHPVLPWAAFSLIGLWFGRQDLNNIGFLKKVIWISLLIFIIIKTTSILFISLLSNGSQEMALELSQVLGTSPMPPLPFYMISSSAFALFLISCCILISKKFEKNIIIKALTKTGRLALTFYVLHVVIGMGIISVFSDTPLGMFSLKFSILYAILFSLFCVLFAVVWTKYKKQGPLEWIMRKVTG
jgi:uncharacterized membrane protein YeiB